MNYTNYTNAVTIWSDKYVLGLEDKCKKLEKENKKLIKQIRKLQFFRKFFKFGKED